MEDCRLTLLLSKKSQRLTFFLCYRQPNGQEGGHVSTNVQPLWLINQLTYTRSNIHLQLAIMNTSAL